MRLIKALCFLWGHLSTVFLWLYASCYFCKSKVFSVFFLLRDCQIMKSSRPQQSNLIYLSNLSALHKWKEKLKESQNLISKL